MKEQSLPPVWPKDWGRREITADTWNATYPVGTPVRYYCVQGWQNHRFDLTCSLAYDTINGPMAKLRFGRGGYLLSHLQVLTGLEPQQLEAYIKTAEDLRRRENLADDLRSVGSSLERAAHVLVDRGNVDTGALRAGIESLESLLLEIVRLEESSSEVSR